METSQNARLRERAEAYLTNGKWDPFKSQRIAEDYKEKYINLQKQRRSRNIRDWILENKNEIIDLKEFESNISKVYISEEETMVTKKLSPLQLFRQLPNPRKQIREQNLISPTQDRKKVDKTPYYLERRAILSY